MNPHTYGYLIFDKGGKTIQLILEINPLSVVSFAIIFSRSEGCLFTLLMVSFAVQKLLNLIRSHLFTFLNFHYSRRWVKEDLALIYVIECSAYVFL